MKRTILAVVIIFAMAVSVQAQTWYPANQVTLAWDAVPQVQPTDSPNKYQVYSKFGVSTATPQKTGTEITANQQTISLTVEGRYYFCVESIRYAQGETVGMKSAKMACSDVSADTATGDFGVIFLSPPATPKMLKLQ